MRMDLSQTPNNHLCSPRGCYWPFPPVVSGANFGFTLRRTCRDEADQVDGFTAQNESERAKPVRHSKQ